MKHTCPRVGTLDIQAYDSVSFISQKPPVSGSYTCSPRAASRRPLCSGRKCRVHLRRRHYVQVSSSVTLRDRRLVSLSFLHTYSRVNFWPRVGTNTTTFPSFLSHNVLAMFKKARKTRSMPSTQTLDMAQKEYSGVSAPAGSTML